MPDQKHILWFGRPNRSGIPQKVLDRERILLNAVAELVDDLIDIIGPQNAYLSVYENDSGPETKEALQELAAKVKCKLLGSNHDNSLIRE